MIASDDELLSALVDGELQDEELDRAIALLSTDHTARERFQRYQLASNVLHGQAIRCQQGDITQQISAAIANEPSHSTTVVQAAAEPINSVEKSTATVLTFPERFWKQTVALAVAASFGALAVVGTITQPEYIVAPANTMAAVDDTSAITVAIQQPSNRWTVTEQEIEDRLNVYLVDHNEYAGASDVFSNARVIAYESGQ
ncbi:MAG: sigma-E factor negative regulatory protein RseA [Methylophagaceae bacterium]|jgi:sigma-E factor negative regulatory protein RseA